MPTSTNTTQSDVTLTRSNLLILSLTGNNFIFNTHIQWLDLSITDNNLNNENNNNAQTKNKNFDHC